jgi:hypothetical protein
MLSDLERKRMSVELIRVSAAKAELEFRIEERLDEINRIKEHIKISELKELELREKIKEAQNV